MKIMKIVFRDLDLEVTDTPKLRGSIASKFPDLSLLHHHMGEDKFLYHYPRIQYKVVDGVPMIIGFKEGIDILKKIYCDIGELKIGHINTTNLQSEISIDVAEQSFGESKNLVEYYFVTPWMALNQKNHKLFVTSAREKNDKLLNSILIGNVLSLSKSVGYRVKSQIYTKLSLVQEKATLKNNEMLTFRGRFTINFNIPDYLGIGKSVSRGFGTIKKS